MGATLSRSAGFYDGRSEMFQQDEETRQLVSAFNAICAEAARLHASWPDVDKYIRDRMNEWPPERREFFTRHAELMLNDGPRHAGEAHH